jgi:hypothetical protein
MGTKAKFLVGGLVTHPLVARLRQSTGEFGDWRRLPSRLGLVFAASALLTFGSMTIVRYQSSMAEARTEELAAQPPIVRLEPESGEFAAPVREASDEPRVRSKKSGVVATPLERSKVEVEAPDEREEVGAAQVQTARVRSDGARSAVAPPDLSPEDQGKIPEWLLSTPEKAPAIQAPQATLAVRPPQAPPVVSRDAEEVLAALDGYSKAWSGKDVDGITSARPGLVRKTVRSELAAVRSITMRVQPLSAPRISGDRATVECSHQVDQIFWDGVAKQSPGVRMTYTLAKRGGRWVIEDSR